MVKKVKEGQGDRNIEVWGSKEYGNLFMPLNHTEDIVVIILGITTYREARKGTGKG